MTKERKSPQQKKELEYTRDHFTFGWVSSRKFPQTWKRKKARVNREYRHKSEGILAKAKPGVASTDVELIADDLTAARFQKSISRRRLRKVGTVTVGEKVKRKLEKREDVVARRVRRDQRYDSSADSAMQTLISLEGEQLVEFVRRADLLCNARSSSALKNVLPCKDQFDHALYFLYLLTVGSFLERDAVRRRPELSRAFERWIEKANRVLAKSNRATEVKLQQREVVRKKLRALRDP
jgi:hypothetical protein